MGSNFIMLQNCGWERGPSFALSKGICIFINKISNGFKLLEGRGVTSWHVVWSKHEEHSKNMEVASHIGIPH